VVRRRKAVDSPRVVSQGTVLEGTCPEGFPPGGYGRKAVSSPKTTVARWSLRRDRGRETASRGIVAARRRSRCDFRRKAGIEMGFPPQGGGLDGISAARRGSLKGFLPRGRNFHGVRSRGSDAQRFVGRKIDVFEAPGPRGVHCVGRFRKVAAQGIARWAATGTSGGREAFEVLEPSPVTLPAVTPARALASGSGPESRLFPCHHPPG
jgi:hypothetical protein